MNTKQAKQIPIDHFLGKMGHKPVKSSGHDLWYKSPLRAEDNTPSFKDFEKGVLGPTGEWINKHGSSGGVPDLDRDVRARLRGIVIKEARGRGWLPQKGTSNLNLRGNNLTNHIKNGLNRTGSLRYLKVLGAVLGPIGAVSGLMDNTHTRTCAMDPSHPACF